MDKCKEIILHEEHRDIAVAIYLCQMKDGEELVVHKENGEVEYTLSSQEVHIIKNEMIRLLKESNNVLPYTIDSSSPIWGIHK